MAPLSMTASIAARSLSTRSGSVTPKTARQMTSNVSARIRSRITSSWPGAPASDLGLGDVADHLAERLDRRALERGQKELALAHVLGTVEHQDRVVAEHARERRVRLACMEVRLIAGHQLADRLGVGDVDAGAEDQVLRGEEVAVAAVPAEQRLDRAHHETRRVHGRGGSRARGQLRHLASGSNTAMMAEWSLRPASRHPCS